MKLSLWLLFFNGVAIFGADCTARSVASFAVSGVTIEAAAEVPASAAAPAYCRITGTVVTSGGGAPEGSARFDVRLPATWNGKFFFYGVGGLAGSIPAQYDSEGGLARGYAVAVTDAGHQGGNTDARWALTPSGKPDTAKVVDYYHRAAHSVTVAAKQLVEKYYDAGSIQKAYFGGCSNGGRMALQEAERYPGDYDGIVSGAPFLSIREVLLQIKLQKASVNASYLAPGQMQAIDRAVYASCDAVDGVKDGLIVDPGRCSFDPAALVCKPGASGECLSREQADFLHRYMEPLRDSRGRAIVPGFAITDLAGGPGAALWTTGMTPPDRSKPDLWAAGAPLGWQFASHILQYLVQQDPGYQPLRFDISPQGVVAPEALALFDQRTGEGSPDDPAKLLPFLAKGGKLLLYHGWSDPALPPYETVLFYERLAALKGNRYPALQESARLFMIPGMQHCGGGPGPDRFDLLGAIDDWVAKKEPPERITATKYGNGQVSGTVVRTMPLCKFPEMPRYRGSGDVKQAENWVCSERPSLLETGPNGIAAGLSRNGRPEPR